MEPKARVVYNRSDCPYGCGTLLAPDLRWQGTPCEGCGRPLYPLSDVVDGEQRVLWPPAGIPRPPEVGLPGVQVWYVVGEEEARDRIALSKASTQRRVDAAEERSCLVIGLVLILVLVVALALFVVLVLAPR